MTTAAFYNIIYLSAIIIYWLTVAAVTIKIVAKKQSNANIIAWLLIVYLLPILGLCAYLAFGEIKIGKRREEQAKKIWPMAIIKLEDILNQREPIAHISTLAKPLFNLCQARQGIPSSHANEIQTFTDSAHTMAKLIEDIQSAQDNIKIVFYIWSVGGTEEEVTEALCQAAKRGVTCRIMLDSAGSHRFFRSQSYKKLTEAGIRIVAALPVSIIRGFFRRMDLRQHRKMVLIDDYIVYTGSMNMVDPEFFKQGVGVGEWVDLMIRMEGSVCLLMEALYNNDWMMETKETIPFSSFEPPNISANINQQPTASYETHVIASGPGFPEEIIKQTLLSVIYGAQKKIVFTTPYFVPSDDLFLAICTAAQRGIEVVLILPKRGDSKMTNGASRSFYRELLASGVIVQEFDGGLLHTKSVLIDDQLSLVGTVNLDIRSLWLNFEVTVAIDSKKFAKKLRLIHEEYLKESTSIDASQWANRPLRQHILERLCYFFSPFL